MYALIVSGGQQHKVEPGRYITVRRLPQDEGQAVTFDRVLMVRTESTTEIGTPTVEGAVVQGTVRRHLRGPKINGLKYRPKKGYQRRWGARADLTQVDITEVSFGGQALTAAAVEPEAAAVEPVAAEAEAEVVAEPVEA